MIMTGIVHGTRSCATTCYVAAVDNVSRETTARPSCGSLREEAAAAEVMFSSDARSNEPAVPRSINQLEGPPGGPSHERKQLLSSAWITGQAW